MSENNVNALSFEFDRSNMFEPLLQADPSFREKWEVFREEYRSADELPLYLALSELARHLIQDLETGNTHRFEAIFDVVERWHINGDPYVQEAATVGPRRFAEWTFTSQNSPRGFSPMAATGNSQMVDQGS
ncbi:hypothetical protein LZK76_06140 [Rhizobium leguminosarum]|nr:hypothetical protein LZK76_06140 [Rhizobium leguminosarum]